MKKVVLLVVMAALMGGVVGCMQWFTPPEEGIVRITIVRQVAQTQAISPKWIPLQADKVRVRIWHSGTGTNIVRSVTIQTRSQTVAIAVPAQEGYNVDAIAYIGDKHVALTGARQSGVAIDQGQTTDVELVLAQWHSEFDQDSVESGEVYSITCDLGASAGPTLAIFDYGLLYIFDAQTASATWESAAVVIDGKVTLTGHAPTVDAPTPFYALVRIALRPEWNDPNNRGSLWLEMPARFLGEPLHEIIVNPPGGSLNVTIN